MNTFVRKALSGKYRIYLEKGKPIVNTQKKMGGLPPTFQHQTLSTHKDLSLELLTLGVPGPNTSMASVLRAGESGFTVSPRVGNCCEVEGCDVTDVDGVTGVSDDVEVAGALGRA